MNLHQIEAKRSGTFDVNVLARALQDADRTIEALALLSEKKAIKPIMQAAEKMRHGIVQQLQLAKLRIGQ